MLPEHPIPAVAQIEAELAPVMAVVEARVARMAAIMAVASTLTDDELDELRKYAQSLADRFG